MSAAPTVAQPTLVESVPKRLSIDGGWRDGIEEYLDTTYVAIARS